jgi:hypothetical protein
MDRRRAQYSANPAKVATLLTLEIGANRISKVLLRRDLYSANGFHKPACGQLRSVSYTLTTAMVLARHLGGRTYHHGEDNNKEGRLPPSYSLCNPQFQSFNVLLGHFLQSHRGGQIQSGNVFHFVAACYLAMQFLYFRISAHFQKHFIRIGDGQSLFNQAMLNQNAMVRRHCQRRWMGQRNALALFWVFHGTMLTRFLNAGHFFGAHAPRPE